VPVGVWSAKDERQYEKILSSCKRRRKGRGKTKTCKRIAAATVNKQRKREGRTLGRSSSCPHAVRFRELVNMSPAEIRKWAKDPRSKCYSWEATRKRLPRLAKLVAKPDKDWTAADCKFAARVVNFNARMSGAARKNGCTPGYAISLRNWGRKMCGVPKTCKGR
jgi:hypothetical protein